jgi:hypothetical protein
MHFRVISHVTFTGARNPILAILALNDHTLIPQLIERILDLCDAFLRYRSFLFFQSNPFFYRKFPLKERRVQKLPAGEKIEAGTFHGIEEETEVLFSDPRAPGPRLYLT